MSIFYDRNQINTNIPNISNKIENDLIEIRNNFSAINNELNGIAEMFNFLVDKKSFVGNFPGERIFAINGDPGNGISTSASSLFIITAKDENLGKYENLVFFVSINPLGQPNVNILNRSFSHDDSFFNTLKLYIHSTGNVLSLNITTSNLIKIDIYKYQNISIEDTLGWKLTQNFSLYSYSLQWDNVYSFSLSEGYPNTNLSIFSINRGNKSINISTGIEDKIESDGYSFYIKNTNSDIAFNVIKQNGETVFHVDTSISINYGTTFLSKSAYISSELPPVNILFPHEGKYSNLSSVSGIIEIEFPSYYADNFVSILLDIYNDNQFLCTCMFFGKIISTGWQNIFAFFINKSVSNWKADFIKNNDKYYIYIFNANEYSILFNNPIFIIKEVTINGQFVNFNDYKNIPIRLINSTGFSPSVNAILITLMGSVGKIHSCGVIEIDQNAISFSGKNISSISRVFHSIGYYDYTINFITPLLSTGIGFANHISGTWFWEAVKPFGYANSNGSSFTFSLHFNSSFSFLVIEI